MRLYIRYGIIYVALVLGLNLAFDFSWATVGNFFLCAAIICFPAIVVSVVVRLLPKAIYNPKNKLFAERKNEPKLFEKLGVKKWKDSIPEAGGISGFSRNHLYDPRNPEYIRRYIIEGCIAEALHTLSICWGIIALLFIRRELILPMGAPLVLFNFFVHIFPLVIQRYMRPRLLRTLERLTKLEERKLAEEKAGMAGEQLSFDQITAEPTEAKSKTENEPAEAKTEEQA
ncbi:MAG: hypothetical protein IJ542_01815 [Clostridia bacterium]|nr:hypothetical protein [Clostridia bacterium]